MELYAIGIDRWWNTKCRRYIKYISLLEKPQVLVPVPDFLGSKLWVCFLHSRKLESEPNEYNLSSFSSWENHTPSISFSWPRSLKLYQHKYKNQSIMSSPMLVSTSFHMPVYKPLTLTWKAIWAHAPLKAGYVITSRTIKSRNATSSVDRRQVSQMTWQPLTPSSLLRFLLVILRQESQSHICNILRIVLMF